MYKLLSRLGIEFWKDIPEFEGIYQVSNLGNVRSLNYRRSGKTKILKHLIVNKRYSVNLYKNKIPYPNSKISVLIAKAFLNHKSCGTKLVVDHIDNNPINDNLYNLQILTHRENLTKDSVNKTGYTGVSKCSNGNKFYAQIIINKKYYYLGSYKNEQEAAQAYQKELNKITQ
jgi:hypothetical protein